MKDAPANHRALPANQAWTVVAVMHFAYIVSFVDRTALSLLVGPIQASLSISDTQFGLLQGLAFGLLYAILGIPFGWLADRTSRKTLVAVGVVFWSFATAWCGLARSFVELFLARVSVGVGEATLSPTAPSMISDAFTPEKRSMALGVYQAAASIGVGVALIIGGAVSAIVAAGPPVTMPWFGTLEPWRVVFLVLAAPGAAVALAVLLLREPPRAAPSRSSADASALVQLRARSDVYVLHFGAFALFTIYAYGALGWIPSHFVRNFEWSIGQVGFWYGLAFLIGGPLGAVTGGALASKLSGRGVQGANGLVIAIGLAAISVAGVAAPLLANPYWAVAAFGVVAFFFAFPSGVSLAFLAEITPAPVRGRIVAIYYLVINILGATVGALAIGWLNDVVFQSPKAVNLSLAVLCAVSCPLAALCAWRARARASASRIESD